MEKLKQHISQLNHFGSFVQELRLLVITFSPIPLFLWILVQVIKLTHIWALSFFSWTQVINDSASIGWLFLMYLILVAGFSSWVPTIRRARYFHLGMILIMGPLFVYFSWALLDWWDSTLTTFDRSFRAFAFLFCTFLSLYFLQLLYRDLWSRFQQFRVLQKKIDESVHISANPSNTQNVTFVSLLIRSGIVAFLSIYYFAFSSLSGFFAYDYFNRHYLAYFTLDNQVVYLANYYNDKYIFSVGKDRATMVVPITQVKRFVTARASTNVYDGFRVRKIDDARIEMLWLTGSVDVHENSVFNIVSN